MGFFSLLPERALNVTHVYTHTQSRVCIIIFIIVVDVSFMIGAEKNRKEAQ